jgi:hypothetical protein
MRPFIAGFTAELQKLAQNDQGGESPTLVHNDPEEMILRKRRKT